MSRKSKKSKSKKAGRPVKKAARKHRKKTVKLHHIFHKKARVKTMAKRKRHSKRRMHGLEGLEGRRMMSRRQVVVMGARKRGKRRSRGYLMGGDGIVSKMGNNALNVAAGVAGGVGGAFIANMIPATGKIKALIPLVGGIALASGVRVPALKFAGIGLSIIAGLSLVRQIMPGVPMLAGMGDPVSMLPAPAPAPALSADDDMMGDPVDVANYPLAGWSTQNDT